MQCRYRTILSIDGGGIRGILPLLILQHIQSNLNHINDTKSFTDWINLFAGTSTGAIISGALMLSDVNGNKKYTVNDILHLYKSRGKQIFNEALNLNTSHPEYPLKFILEQNFGNSSIQDVKKHFIFLSYDLNSQEPFIFKDDMKWCKNLALSKVMMACSAIPGYFPPIELGEKVLADGMFTAKNPAMLALEYARLYYPDDPIILISLGTGSFKSSLNDKIENDCSNVHRDLEILEKQNKNLIYFRFQPELLLSNSDLADTSDENLLNLERDTLKYIDENVRKFQQLYNFMALCE
ncbi:MAG: patatin-like phospholipase family protein [Lishizhenia sp.]